MTEINSKPASPERLAQITKEAEPILEYIQDYFNVPRGMEVVMFVVCQMFLDAKPAAGETRLTAFDKYAAIMRETIEKNEKLNLQQTTGRTQ